MRRLPIRRCEDAPPRNPGAGRCGEANLRDRLRARLQRPMVRRSGSDRTAPSRLSIGFQNTSTLRGVTHRSSGWENVSRFIWAKPILCSGRLWASMTLSTTTVGSDIKPS